MLIVGMGVFPQSGSAQSLPEDTAYAKNHGAVGDGTTDDTQALQAALNAAAGKTLYIEPGTYLISGVTVNGPTRVIANGVTLKAAGAGSPLLSVQKTTSIEGIGLDGNGKTQAGVNISNANGVILSACRIKNINHDPGAIVVYRVNSFKITGCTIDGSSVDGIHIEFSSHGEVNNNTITNSHRHGIEWWGGDSAHPKGPNGVSFIKFVGNTVINSGAGGIWGSMGEDLTLTNNTVEECGDVCLDPEGGTRILVKDNQVHNGKNGGITVFYRATHIEVSQNMIVQDAGYDAGIKIYGSGFSRHLSILGNIITTDGRDAILGLAGTTSDSTIVGNYIILKAGGSGVKIVGGRGNTVHNNTVITPSSSGTQTSR